MPDVHPIVLDDAQAKRREYDPNTDNIPGVTGTDILNGFYRIKSGENLVIPACRQSVTLGGILVIEAGATLTIAGQYFLRF